MTLTKLLSLMTVALSIVACGSQEIEAPSSSDEPNDYSLTNASEAHCPQGSTFRNEGRMCVTSSGSALGPFPSAMVAECSRLGGGKACQSSKWDYRFALKIRGNATCPKGTTLDNVYSECTDGTHAFGPFSKDSVAICQTKGGGNACVSSMRWSLSALNKVTNNSNVHTKLFNFYSQRVNYNKVYDNVMGWFGTRTNGCVAFMSTALRMIGVDVPQNGYLDNEPVSLVTRPFSRYLEEKLGWKRFTNPNDLRPGDVVFTQTAPNDPGYPAHTYMFHSWSNKAASVAWVVDNQDFTHLRNIQESGTFNFTPFDYGLRAP